MYLYFIADLLYRYRRDIIILLTIVVIIGFELLPVKLEPIIYILCLLANVGIIYKSRKNYLFLIVSIILTYFNYSIIYADFINNLNNFFTREISPVVTNTSINILSFFNIFLFILYPSKIKEIKNGINYLIVNRDVPFYISWGIICILLVIMLVGFRPSEDGSRSDPSAMYEYAVCIFIVAYCFIKSPKLLVILFMLSLIYAGRNFLYGGRVAGLQVLLCSYLFLFAHRTRISVQILLGVLVFILLSVVGVVRGAMIEGEFEINNIIMRIVDSGFVLDTAYSAYYTSEIFVYMDSLLNNHFTLFLIFLAAVFVGYGMFPDMLLQNYADLYMVNYAGGILPFYFWVFLGCFGLYIAVLMVKLYLNVLNKSLEKADNGLLKCVGAFFVCHIFRWYLYTPYSLLRGTLIICLVYMLVNFFSIRYTKKRLSISQ